MKFTVYLVYTLIALLCIDEETSNRTMRHYWMNVTERGVSPTCSVTMMPILDYSNVSEPIDWPATLRCTLPVISHHQPLTPCMTRIVNMSHGSEFDAALIQNQECLARFMADEIRHRPDEKWHCHHLVNLINTNAVRR